MDIQDVIMIQCSPLVMAAGMKDLWQNSVLYKRCNSLVINALTVLCSV